MKIKVRERIEYITVMETAKRLGVTRFVIYRRLLAKKIDYTIIAGHYCIPMSEINRLLKGG